MRSSEGVSEGGKQPKNFAVTENPPRPGRRPRCSTGLWHSVLRQVARVTQDGTSPGLCTCAENAAHKRGITLGTHISGTPDWPAAGYHDTRMGSNTQRDQWAAGPCKGAPVMPGRCCSETKKCGHTAPIPPPKPKRLRSSLATGMPWSCTWYRAPVNCRVWDRTGRTPSAWQAKIAGGGNRDPPHPDRLNARPARHWSLCDGRGERRTEGHLRLRAGRCGRSEAAENQCRMAATHGAGETPVAAHVSPSAARSQALYTEFLDSSRQRQGRNRVWIRESKVWGRRYGRGMESEV